MWTLSFLFSLPGDLIGLGRDVIGILHTPGVSLVSILGGVALVVFGIWLVGRVLGTGGSDTTAFGMDPRLAAALGAAAMTFGALAVYAGLT